MTQASLNRFVKVEGYGNYSLLLPDTIKKLSVDSPLLEAWIAEILLKPAEFQAKRREASASWYQAVGIAQPEAASDPIAEQLKQLSAVVDQVAPQLKFSAAGPHDAGLETRAKVSLTKIFPQAKVRGTVMDEAGWTIEKNGLGVPLSRFRSGQIVFARPETKWCLQRTFNYVEQYAGGGTYAPGPQVNILPMTKFVTCP